MFIKKIGKLKNKSIQDLISKLNSKIYQESVVSTAQNCPFSQLNPG